MLKKYKVSIITPEQAQFRSLLWNHDYDDTVSLEVLSGGVGVLCKVKFRADSSKVVLPINYISEKGGIKASDRQKISKMVYDMLKTGMVFKANDGVVCVHQASNIKGKYSVRVLGYCKHIPVLIHRAPSAVLIIAGMAGFNMRKTIFVDTIAVIRMEKTLLADEPTVSIVDNYGIADGYTTRLTPPHFLDPNDRTIVAFLTDSNRKIIEDNRRKLKIKPGITINYPNTWGTYEGHK